ncbi:MAG: tetratricopeptide repeat protein [Rickettsiaceae bacterium]|nr:tetratricopeptide repeat protein [Rickettsiaceae bacterium]
MALSKLGRYIASIISYDEAIRLNPDFAVAYYNKGKALLMLQRYIEAIKSFDEAIKLNSDYLDAIEGRETALRVIEEQNNNKANENIAQEFREQTHQEVVYKKEVVKEVEDTLKQKLKTVTRDNKQAQNSEEEQDNSNQDDASLATQNNQAFNYFPKASVSPKLAIETNLPANNNINEPGVGTREFTKAMVTSLIESLESNLSQYNIKLSSSQKIDLNNTLSQRWVYDTKSKDWLILESASKDNEFRNDFINILSSSIIEQFIAATPNPKSIKINPDFIRKIIDQLKHENSEYSSNNEGNTNISYIKDIIYDNPLLNKPETIEQILTSLGPKVFSDMLDEYEQAKIFSCKNHYQEQVLSIEDINHASLLGLDWENIN